MNKYIIYELEQLEKISGCSLQHIKNDINDIYNKLQEKDNEIERLNNEIKTLLKENGNKEKVIIKQNNIIDELEKYIIQKESENNEILKNKYKVGHYISEKFEETLGDRNDIYDCILDKLKALKESRGK